MDGNFRLQNRLNLLCRVWPSGQCPKDACFGLSLTLCTIFKICSQFLENAIFRNRKNSISSNVLTLRAFFFLSGAPSCSHAHNELVENLVKDFFT